MGRIIPYIMENQKCSKPPTRIIVIMLPSGKLTVRPGKCYPFFVVSLIFQPLSGKVYVHLLEGNALVKRKRKHRKRPFYSQIKGKSSRSSNFLQVWDDRWNNKHFGWNNTNSSLKKWAVLPPAMDQSSNPQYHCSYSEFTVPNSSIFQPRESVERLSCSRHIFVVKSSSFCGRSHDFIAYPPAPVFSACWKYTENPAFWVRSSSRHMGIQPNLGGHPDEEWVTGYHQKKSPVCRSYHQRHVKKKPLDSYTLW